MAGITTPGQLCDVLKVPFSDQQLAAITAGLEPAVIIAGAGSGKTTVMAARVVWLVGSGALRPQQVLGLTFTRKAAGELSQRIRTALAQADVLGEEDGEELILTYDAFAGRLVNEHGMLLGLEDGQRMITGAARYRLAARVVNDAVGPWQHLSRLRPATITSRVVDLASQLRSHLLEPGDLAHHAEGFLAAAAGAPTTARGNPYAAITRSAAVAGERLELARLVIDYEELKARLGFVEFADQMAWAARLAREVPGVADAVREEFGVVLLDEYQDTSAAQASLLTGLFSGTDPGTGRGHAVTAVGDPCQAIYTWRGAAASNILQFDTDFPRADGRPAQRYALTVNRRSGPQILAAANELSAPIRSDPQLLGRDLDLSLVCPDDTPAARVVAAQFDTWPQEIGWLADEIISARSIGEVAAWSDIAVLTRRNAHAAQMFEALTERGVPAEIVGLGGLLELPAVVDVVAALRLLADPTDNPALIRILAGPRWAIGLPDLALLGERAAELAGRHRPHEAETLPDALGALLAGLDAGESPSLLEAAASPGEAAFSTAARERLARFSAEFKTLRRAPSESVVDLCERVIDASGLSVEIAVAGGDPSYLRSFVEAVAGYAAIDQEASLAGLLAYLDAEREYGSGLEQPVISQANSVKLLTVHKAKGLEWDLVFLPALAVDVFPTDRVSGNWLRNAAVVPHSLRGDASAVPQVREVTQHGFTRFADELTADQRLGEDRLAYVAATRARRRLVGSTHVWAEGLVKPRQPSGYWETIASHADLVRPAWSISSENPLTDPDREVSWPALGEAGDQLIRRAGAALVQAPPGEAPVHLDEVLEAEAWERWSDHLCDLALSEEHREGNPDYLTVTGLARWERDPEGFLVDLRRPMPRFLDAALADGIEFHRWIEHRFTRPDPLASTATDAPSRLVAAFLAGPYGAREPLAVEVPFTLQLHGRLVRGRIDAVYAGPEPGTHQVVDWKTGSAGRASWVQLAMYRLAWAELNGLSLGQVTAAFYEVPTGETLRPPFLLDRDGLERWAAGVVDTGVTPITALP